MAEESKLKTPYNQQFPGNSHKSKEEPAAEEKQIEKIVTGTVTRKKKGLGRKIAETFTGDDARNVAQYVIFDVAVPALKSMMLDMLIQGGERMFFGETRGRSGRSVGTKSTYTSYNKMYDRRDSSSPIPRTLSQRARATHDFDEIILETRVEAENVLDGLDMILRQYDLVTVADLYQLLGMSPSFTDDKYGWTDLRGSSVRNTRGGYRLELPHTSPID